jgi:hypothetical protein
VTDSENGCGGKIKLTFEMVLKKLMENKSAKTSASKSAMYLAGATTNGHLNFLALL